MPPELDGQTFYHPSTQGRELRFQARMDQINEWHRKHN